MCSVISIQPAAVYTKYCMTSVFKVILTCNDVAYSFYRRLPYPVYIYIPT